MTKKDNVVPLDKDFENMIISATRYAFGRRTYIVDLTIGYVVNLLPLVSDWCLAILKKDYNSNKEMAERTNDYRFFGDECDKQDWFRFADKLQAEIDRRMNDGNRHDFLR